MYKLQIVTFIVY